MKWKALFALCSAIPLTISTVSGIAVAQDHDQILQSLLAEARVAQSNGDFSQAADAYRKAVALEPSIPELRANLGLMDYESGNHPEAITNFKEAIRFKPSLFGPQLFLGLEYLQASKADIALPYLQTAVKLNPGDPQAVRALGKAYGVAGNSEKSTELYRQVVQLDPNEGGPWFDLGTSYLLQVENDARQMTSAYNKSVYLKLRSAEVLAAEGKLIDAEEAYNAATASAQPVPCAFAESGIALLRRQKTAEARQQFERELQTGSHCGLVVLGEAIADLMSGDQAAALNRLVPLAHVDAAFVRTSLPLFRGVVTTVQIESFINTARTKADAPSMDLAGLMEKVFISDETTSLVSGHAEKSSGSVAEMQSPTDAQRFAAANQYSSCNEALKGASQGLNIDQLRLLAFCSFYVADYQTTSRAALELKKNPDTRVQGLYWESKADENLAIEALARAGEIDSSSPRMHQLLGDVFRQKRNWEGAEAEYRKALALDPKNRGARLSLAITLFSELKNDEALNLDEALLREDAADAAANLLAAEILVQRNQFSRAEPYLLNCANLEPEFLPRYHSLLGRVYAETDRVPAAIAQYKLGLSTDQDGAIHYQLARLYQKSGNKTAANEAFKESKRLLSQWNDRAQVVLEQTASDMSRQ